MHIACIRAHPFRIPAPKLTHDPLRHVPCQANDAGVQAKVFARQSGRVKQWRDVGTLAALDTGSFSQALAKQWPLVVRWAYLCAPQPAHPRALHTHAPTHQLSFLARTRRAAAARTPRFPRTHTQRV